MAVFHDHGARRDAAHHRVVDARPNFGLRCEVNNHHRFTPPQLTAETSTLARQVDGVILVVKSGSTPREMVEELMESISREKVLGVVMNWFNLRSSRYYGYGKYTKYGQYKRKK